MSDSIRQNSAAYTMQGVADSPSSFFSENFDISKILALPASFLERENMFASDAPLKGGQGCARLTGTRLTSAVRTILDSRRGTNRFSAGGLRKKNTRRRLPRAFEDALLYPACKPFKD